MEFEFDPEKSKANKKKRGIDFHEAQWLWDDPAGIEIQLPDADEPRYARIARNWQNRTEIWSAIYTLRSEKIRLISVRRAREKEKEAYG